MSRYLAESRIGPLKVAYADPPYLGCGTKHYGKAHPEAAAWDTLDAHRDLIARLSAEYPDGWALSLSSPSLRLLLPLCPEDARVCAWVKPFASFKPGVRRAYAWEPIIVSGGRDPEYDTVRDWVSANITLRRGTAGAKPDAFSWWLFQFMGLQHDDEFVDLFPGSGAVTRAWEAYRSQRPLLVSAPSGEG